MSAEHARLLANLIKSGVIDSVDEGGLTVRVKIGALTTDSLPYFVPAAGGVSVGRVPSVGESCVVLSESGELASGTVLCGIASNKFPAATGDSNIHITKYSDGASFIYDSDASALTISGVKAVNVTTEKSMITCPDNTMTGDLKIGGALTVTKAITGAGGLAISGGVAGGASATFTGNIEHRGGRITSTAVIEDGHKHKVTALGALTGEPTK